MLPMNMFTEQWPSATTEGHNAIFMANVIHDWSPQSNCILMKKAYESLPQNGWILLFEAMLPVAYHQQDDVPPAEMERQKLAAYLSLHMLVYTEGRQHTFQEIEAQLQQAGFCDVHVIPMQKGIHSLVTARKR